MPKSAVILTDLQITYLIELFENDSINDKRIEIPLRFNIKFSSKYSYNCLQIYYLKNGYNKSSNTKRKLNIFLIAPLLMNQGVLIFKLFELDHFMVFLF